jgi:hypothetical protein
MFMFTLCMCHDVVFRCMWCLSAAASLCLSGAISISFRLHSDRTGTGLQPQTDTTLFVQTDTTLFIKTLLQTNKYQHSAAQR